MSTSSWPDQPWDRPPGQASSWPDQPLHDVRPPDAMMDRWFECFTETSTLMLFDPAAIEREDKSESAWWNSEDVVLREVMSQHFAPVQTTRNGSFRVLVTAHVPDAPLRQSSVVRVQSGRLCMSSGDRLPYAGDPGPDFDDSESFPIPNGSYSVDVRTPESDSVDAPEYVLTLTPLLVNAPAIPSKLGPVPPATHPAATPVDEQAVKEADARVAQAAQSEDTAEQLQGIESVLQLDPRHFMCLNFRAVIRQQQGDLQGAIADARLATTVRPHYGNGWNSLAYFLLLAKKPEEAYPAARRAVELAEETPEPAYPWNNLGDALAALGREREAIPYWRKSLSLGHPEAEDIEQKIKRAWQNK